MSVKCLKKIQKDFVKISCSKKGTYAIQGILDIINLREEENVIKDSIGENLILMCFDNYGTHVIQKLISCIEEQNRDFINNQIVENFLKLVLDVNGICIAKAFISSNSSTEVKKRLLDAIITNCLEIVQNPFGNYVIQEIFERWGIDYCSEVLKILHNNIISLSMQKYSSNVVEKSIEMPDINIKRKILKELFFNPKISSLLKNKFGNFVVQKALKLVKADETLKIEIKESLNKKLVNSNLKDKQRITTLIEML